MNNSIKFLLLALLLFTSHKSSGQNYNYTEVLQKSLFFYECQRSGALPANNRVNWRGNSGMNDGADNKTDLTGGWYDAGDHVKFGFPMAHSATRLAWSGIENKAAYQSSGLWTLLLENIKWVNDYFLRCHKRNGNGSTVRFYGQVGKGADDHGWWGPAEVMPMARPSYYVDATLPGSELTAETAAALAAASMVFASDDPTYSSLLLNNAIALYGFAETYKGKYTASITDAKNFYESYSGYTDELAWGALWLYKASGNSAYLTKAKTYYTALPNETRETVKAYSWGDNWDNKAFATYILMAMTTGETIFKNDAERYLDFWTQGYNGKKVTYSPGGQAFLDQWGSLRYAANTAFLALLYGKYIQNSNTARATLYTNFGLGQIHYILGSNPNNRSYVIGFGNNPPKNPHHRTSHSSWTASINEPLNNRHILYGALVGGPGRANDAYTDSRSDYQSNEVACDYNAGFTCAIAFLVEKFGGSVLPDFPQPETVSSCSEFICSGISKGTSFKLRLQNRTGWPARKETNACYRYYFGLDGNLKISDYKATLSYTSKPGATVAIYPYNSTTGYIEVCMPGIEIVPGGATICYVETQIAFGLRTGLSSTLFNYKNDWSYYKADNVALSTTSETQRVAVFSNGNKVCGILPPSLLNNSFSSGARLTDAPTEPYGLSVNIYPNPSSGPAKLEILCREEGNYMVEIYNGIGQRISTQRLGKLVHGTHHVNVSLPAAQKGILLIHIKEESGQKKWIGKMVREN